MPANKTELEFSKELTIKQTTIPGLLVVNLPVYGDPRGWFKENFQKEKMTKLGLPEFNVVQNNISFNNEKGTTRGIHAEPWNKYISVGSGRVFGAWVDLRPGDNFGKVFTAELDPTKAIFVPRGVGNAFQALEDNTVYTYLVDDHWSPDAKLDLRETSHRPDTFSTEPEAVLSERGEPIGSSNEEKQVLDGDGVSGDAGILRKSSIYTFLNLADETVNIKWPIPLDQAELSDKDKNHPRLSDVVPMEPKRTLITGSNGQLGRALQIEFPDAEFTDCKELDITSPDLETARNWRQYDTIINAAAYTAVDKAETPEGRETAWKINASAIANLEKIATKYNITLVHISSDYVFDGTKTNHTEDEPFSPLGVYGQTKAAGDIAAALAPKHYVLRTSWVIGDGNNFVRTMKSLAEKGVKPNVVNDQIGRLTFTSDLAKCAKYLLANNAPYGTYNLSGDGKPASWADIAAEVYELTDHNRDTITGISTEEYYQGKDGIAPRPLQSTLNLDKIKAIGFQPTNWQQSLNDYLNNEANK